MKTALTPEILTSHGFVEIPEGNVIGAPVYRLSNIKDNWGDYGFDIDVVLNLQYQESNPNCGIVSLHSPAFTSAVVPRDLWDKEDWTEEDQERADNNLVPFEEHNQPIAWHVTTYERLHAIVKSLTLINLEYGK